MTGNGLESLLGPFKGQRAWLLPLSDERGHTFANNGDLLMHRIFYDICQEFGIELTDDPVGVDFVAIPPNGALLDRFRAPDIVKSRLRPFRDKPLVIFPSSAQFLQHDPSKMLEHRSAPTLWILREPYSHNHLERDWGTPLARAGVTLALDHDVVISGAKHLSKHFRHDASRHRHCTALLVGRLGVEAKDIRNNPSNVDSHEQRAGSLIKRAAVEVARSLPASALRPARRAWTLPRIYAANLETLSAAPSAVQDRFNRAARFTGTDLSDTSLASFGEYRRRITMAELVVTNRLHVAIPAALLGKETYLIDSGYHKLRGIYEHSLRDNDSITFVTRS